MKKTIVIVASLLILSGAAWAQMGGGGMMGEEMGWGPGYGYGCGHGMGMMGGMGPGWGYGYGVGHGMMGGMGPGWGMMGGYYNPQMKKFLDETKDIRRELVLKRYEYHEALRDPKTTPEMMQKLQKEIKDLNMKLYEKAPAGW